LANFYQSQPDSIVSQIEVVRMDVSKAYSAATRTHAPQATHQRPGWTDPI
jgi:transposase